jgi:DNA transformation protein
VANLTDLPNLGVVVVDQLKRAGIETPSQLRRLGSVGAALKLTAVGVDVCASKLSALEGAVRGVRWHSIPADERAELMRRFEARRRRGR